MLRPLVGDIVLCSSARQSSLTVPLSTLVFNADAVWTRHEIFEEDCVTRSRRRVSTQLTVKNGYWRNHREGGRITPSRFVLLQPEISADLMGHLACMQTSPT